MIHKCLCIPCSKLPGVYSLTCLSIGSMVYVSALAHSFLPCVMSFTFQLSDIAGPAACILPERHRRELSGPNRQNGQSNSVYASHKRRQYSQPATPTAPIQHHHQQLYTTLRKTRCVLCIVYTVNILYLAVYSFQSSWRKISST